MRKNRLYRIGAGLLAGLLVFTGVPQTVSMAEENDPIVSQQPDAEQDLPDTDDAYIEDTFIEDEPDTPQEDASLVTPDEDIVQEDTGLDTDMVDELTDTTQTPVKRAASLSMDMQEGANASSVSRAAVGEVFQIRTTDSSLWISTTPGDKRFSLERTTTDTTHAIDNKNKARLTAEIDMEALRATLTPEQTADVKYDTAKFVVTQDHDYVVMSEESNVVNNQLTAMFTATSDSTLVGGGYATIRAEIDVVVTTTTTTTVEGETVPITSTETKKFTDECSVYITSLKVRRIDLPSSILYPNKVTLQAGDPTPSYFDVTFIPSDADDINSFEASVYAQSADVVHVTAELLNPEGSNGYRLKLSANAMGNAFVRIRMSSSDVASGEISVEVPSEFPVPPQEVRLCQSVGTGWEEITSNATTSSCVITEGRTLPLRVYFVPDNTNQRNVTLVPDSSLLTITYEAEYSEGAGRYYKVYLVKANSLTDADDERLGSDDCIDVTVTLTPEDATGGAAAKPYKIKVKKDRHLVTDVSADHSTLSLKDRDVASTQDIAENKGSFRVYLQPANATNKGVTLELTSAPANGSIKIKEQGQTDYMTLSLNGSLDATAVTPQNGNSAVCSFEVEAVPDQIGDYIFTVSSKDSTYTRTEQITINVTHHSISGITLSSASLTVYEAPETGYVDVDLKEIEAQIDPIEAANRKIVWTIAPAGSSAGEAAARIVDEGNSTLVTTIETEADETTGKTAVRIIGLKRGECVLTAKSEEDDTVVAQCRVIVTTGRYSVERIELLDGQGNVIDLDTIAMRPDKTLDLQAKVIPTTAINADLTVTRGDTTLLVSLGETAGGITPVHIESGSQENGEGSTVTVHAGGREKAIKVQIKNPYMEFGQRELHYAPDEVNEAAIRNDLTVRFYKIKDLDPASYELVTNYDLTLITASGVHLTTENVNWAEELSKPGEKTLRVQYTYIENDTEQRFEKDLTLAVSQYPLVDLVRVINPEKVWNVPNGTSLNSMALPKKVDITVRDRNADSSEEDRRMQADVTWDRSSNRYDPNSKEEQNFTLNGTVTLPAGVRNPNGVSLTVQVEVNVREAMSTTRKVSKPEVSVENGVTLAYGSTISLSCATTGATIYYTLDGTEATRDGLRYTAPIKLTEATTVLRAIAYMEGWLDSDPVKIVVYVEERGSNSNYDPNDPDEPVPDDVTPEDKELIGGKTDGLWAVIQDAEGREEKLPVFAYTGDAHKPAVHVYDGTRLLKEKKDYTVSYKNNKNAGGPGMTDKYPAVIITGKGNYDGKIEVPFIIKPQELDDDSVVMDKYVAVAYDKKAHTPAPKLTWNGRKLVNKKDFTYDDKTSYKEPGEYKVQVTGVGNYTGTKILTYEIYENGVPASKFTVSKVADQKYTGNRITPAVTVTYNKVKLTADVNYEIKYENNLNVGTASVVITGLGGYKGTKRIDFKILPIADMKNVAAVLTFEPAAPVYEGKAVKPVSCVLTYQTKKLREGEDYTVSYLNNDKAGTATAVFTGKGPFKGTLKKNFKIEKGSILKASIEMNVSYPYEKGGCKPKPRVILGDRVLVEGTDYSLSYKNNNKIGNTAQVTVKGKGNYAGSLPKFYAVTMQDIGNLKVEASDVVYKPKKNAYKTKVRVYDLNGKKLEAGKDYAEDIIYTYASGPKKDQPVLSTDIVPAGTRIQVEVRVTKPKLYVGTAYGIYRIVEADITNAKVRVLDQEYTGRKVRPNKSQIVSITVKNVPLTDSDYEITGYQNNINQGTAKMTIRGIGNYGGTKEVTFKIKKKGILGLRF